MKSERDQILEEKYSGQECPEFFDDLKKLKKGEPLDYIIGWKPFLNCQIDLSYKPLIPRSETEFWAEKVIEEINNFGKVKVLDIFSGSGCLGIAVAKNCPQAKVDFAEIDENLVLQIKKNLEINEVEGNVFQSDIFSNLEGKYDFILANPPYIDKKREDDIEDSVLEYEPHKALFGGEEGLIYISKFLKEAKKYCIRQIWLEFDSFQKESIEKLLKEYEYGSWKFFKDQYDRWRFAQISVE